MYLAAWYNRPRRPRDTASCQSTRITFCLFIFFWYHTSNLCLKIEHKVDLVWTARNDTWHCFDGNKKWHHFYHHCAQRKTRKIILFSYIFHVPLRYYCECEKHAVTIISIGENRTFNTENADDTVYGDEEKFFTVQKSPSACVMREKARVCANFLFFPNFFFLGVYMLYICMWQKGTCCGLMYKRI